MHGVRFSQVFQSPCKQLQYDVGDEWQKYELMKEIGRRKPPKFGAKRFTEAGKASPGGPWQTCSGHDSDNIGVIKTEGELNTRLAPGMYQMDLDTLKTSV